MIADIQALKIKMIDFGISGKWYNSTLGGTIKYQAP